MFSNLLSNAIKYSPEHARIDIRLRVEARWFIVEVIDTGIGMTPAVLARVFDLFAQADPSLVDDNLDLLEMTRDLLTIAGCEVTTAADGPTGLAEIVTRKPEIAFVDIGLPGIDGYDVARRVRASQLAGVFLVAMTGYGQPEDKQRALAAGFDFHLTKPVTTGSLQAALTVCQGRKVARITATSRR